MHVEKSKITEDRCQFGGCYFQQSERTVLAVLGGPSTARCPTNMINNMNTPTHRRRLVTADMKRTDSLRGSRR